MLEWLLQMYGWVIHYSSVREEIEIVMVGLPSSKVTTAEFQRNRHYIDRALFLIVIWV